MTTSRIRVTRSTASSQVGMVLSLIVLAALAVVPLWGSNEVMRMLIDFFLYLALAYLWNFLAGYAGLVSVGQQAYVGLGGYGLFAMAVYAGISPLVAIVIIGIIAAIVSVPIAALLFRLRGAYFAIGSWVVAEVFRLTAMQIQAIGGGSGMSLPAYVVLQIARSPHERYTIFYWTALILLLVIVGAIVIVLRSRYGMALTAIRDNELAARSNGVDVGRVKLVMYVLTAFGTAMVGAMIFLQKLRVSPDSAFSVNDWTAIVIFIVVIGGLGSFEGPIIGTIIYFVLRETLADLGSVYLMILGAVAIAIMLLARRGVWGLIRSRLDWQLMPLQLRVVRDRSAAEPGA